MAELTPPIDAARDFRMDGEFAALFPVHTDEERQLLAASILAHGVREPLVLWREENILLDGHSRLAICDEHRLPFPVVAYSFEDRDAARRFLIDNALGRRNLTREQRDYLVGRRYLAEKQSHGGERGASRHSDDLPPKTAAKIADAVGVSARTVERAAEFAASIDKISETCPTAKAAILTGAVKLTRAEAARAAAAAPRSLAQVKAAARKPLSLAELNRLANGGKPVATGGGDPVAAINALARQTAAAIATYVQSGARAVDRARLTELWELRSELERLSTCLEGEPSCT